MLICLQATCEAVKNEPDMAKPLFMLNGEQETKFNIVRWCNIGVGKTIGHLKDNLRTGTGPNPAEMLHGAAPGRLSATATATVVALALAAAAVLL
jgi:hypothetical protein